jgi:hypothetical protein
MVPSHADVSLFRRTIAYAAGGDSMPYLKFSMALRDQHIGNRELVHISVLLELLSHLGS